MNPELITNPRVALQESVNQLAIPLTQHIVAGSRPLHRDIHLVEDNEGAQLLLVNGSRLYNLPPELNLELRRALRTDDDKSVEKLIDSWGLQAQPFIDDEPLHSPPMHALSLAIAQKCNLGCTYCYAQQGAFGGKAKGMELQKAIQAIDLLFKQAAPGAKVNVAFMGGEPLSNRSVLREATAYATQQAIKHDLICQFSITTNGTLLTPADADFFEEHGFSVTVSLDGDAEQHDLLR
ncbi:MAG TPA: radical SAM protein, partial [Cellvibrio sp.]